MKLAALFVSALALVSSTVYAARYSSNPKALADTAYRGWPVDLGLSPLHLDADEVIEAAIEQGVLDADDVTPEYKGQLKLFLKDIAKYVIALEFFIVKKSMVVL